MNSPAYVCVNHPTTPTNEVCMDCGRPLCASCLTDLLGGRFCGWCRDARLAGMQRPTGDASQVVMWARIFDAVSLLLGVGGAIACGGFLTYTILGTPTPATPGAPTGTDTNAMLVMLVGVGVTVVASFVLYLPPALGLRPGRPWLWTWQLVALILTLVGSCPMVNSMGILTFVPAVILMIYWLKPEVKAYCESDS